MAQFHGHPCIVSVFTFFEENGTAYMVMPYIEGLTLLDYLKQQPQSRISYQKALNILMPVMDALREVHGKSLLHRDVSPDNIYITNSGQVKLLDFGIARFAIAGITHDFTEIGKAGYAPEEQCRGRGRYGPFTDIYAVGATLYRCITGQVPYQAMDRLAGEEMDWPNDMGLDIPPHIEAMLKTAMAVKGVDRYQTIEDLQAGINADLSGPVTETTIEQPTAGSQTAQEDNQQPRYTIQNTNDASRKWLWLLPVLTLLGFGFYQYQQTEDEQKEQVRIKRIADKAERASSSTG